MSGPIIVGVDGSPTAAAASRAAAELARALGVPLHVLCAFGQDRVREVRGAGTDHWLLSTAEDAANTARETIAGLQQVLGNTPALSEAVQGSPGQALVSHAEKVGAQIIVVGNRRVQGISRVLGSVASDVAQRAPCDVYIVKTV